MPTHAVLDDKSSIIIHGSSFKICADRFLRKDCRLKDTAVRIADEQKLRKCAMRFCQKHLDEFFPKIWITRSPRPDLIFEEVCLIYTNLKVDLLNRARLRSSPEPEFLSATSLLENPEHVTLPPAPREESMPKAKLRKRRRKRHCHDATVQASTIKDGKPFDVMSVSSTIRTFSTEKRRTAQEGRQEPVHGVQLECSSSDSSSVSELVIPERPASLKQHTSTYVSNAISLSSESSERLHQELLQLRKENRILTDYRIFAELTLRVCQDTYLAEAETAETIGIYPQTIRCSAVVEAIRDISSDIDFNYFHDYHLRYGCAPPSRFWLDGVLRGRQKHRLLR